MIVVLADDLSGAAELAGAALGHGLSAEVQTRFVPGAESEVVCVATDTRSLPAESAARIVAQAMHDIITARPAWIFKKCDSVLRGPVLAEARAAAQAAGKNRIVILSANPSRQRVIRNGIYHVAGVPLHETAFARDPEHPRLSSRLPELLGGDLAGVETPDAVSGVDIRRQAATVDDDTLPVGGVDFFEALLELRTSPHPARRQPVIVATGASLLVCGSAASWSQRQKAAVARGIPAFALPHDVEAIVQGLRSAQKVLVGIGDGTASQGVTSAALVQRLAETVVGILGKTNLARVLIEGGATTAAVMQAAGWTRLLACAASDPGVGVLRPAGAVGPLLFIKPGSYEWPNAIWPGQA